MVEFFIWERVFFFGGGSFFGKRNRGFFGGEDKVLEGKVQSPESRVQSPESRVQSPESRAQSSF